MTTWKRGRELLGGLMRQASMPIDLLLDDIGRRNVHRVNGTAVFMTSDAQGAPVVLLHHLKHNQALHRQVGLSRSDSSRMVEQILGEMCEALSRGENVKISGFGTFVLRDKGERVGRNPKTGVEVPIAPRRVLTFRASQIMRDGISGA